MKEPSTHGLARWLSKYGLASRKEAERWVRGGRVTVNGRVTRNPYQACRPPADEIRVDGELLRSTAKVYLALNKPVGYITTARDPGSPEPIGRGGSPEPKRDGGGAPSHATKRPRHEPQRRPTVYELLPPGLPKVQAVGRLDAATSGLLLFTNDTQFGARLIEAETAVEKEYVARLRGSPTPETVKQFCCGVLLDGRPTREARCRILKREPHQTLVSVVITEGRNRQVRRMWEALGHPVLDLKRVRIGPIRLGALPPGTTRSLTRREKEPSAHPPLGAALSSEGRGGGVPASRRK